MVMGKVDDEMSPGTRRVRAFQSFAARGREDSAKEMKKKLIEEKHVLSWKTNEESVSRREVWPTVPGLKIWTEN